MCVPVSGTSKYTVYWVFLLFTGQLWNATVEKEVVCFVRLLLVLLQR